jgi:DNA-binding MarR family transcriptional regulator
MPKMSPLEVLQTTLARVKRLLDPFRLSPQQACILFALNDAGRPLTTANLTGLMEMSQFQVNMASFDLADRGLITRSATRIDGRKFVTLEITELGKVIQQGAAELLQLVPAST